MQRNLLISDLNLGEDNNSEITIELQSYNLSIVSGNDSDYHDIIYVHHHHHHSFRERDCCCGEQQTLLLTSFRHLTRFQMSRRARLSTDSYVQSMMVYSNIVCISRPHLHIISTGNSSTRAVLRLVWPFDGIVQKHIHKRLI